ncbi:MAG: acyl-CoA dehydrogenase family protein, partial [Sterolibacterium sp.]
MNDYLAWPFFDEAHRNQARDLNAWAKEHIQSEPERDADEICRTLVSQLGAAGWLRYCVGKEYGGAHEAIDVRSLCLMRENLAQHSGLADFAFAMQGLGSGAISLGGSSAL